jgi:23S rRNA (guanosine2251-2'-O)-methyltransferase
VDPRRFSTIDDVLARAAERGEPPFVLVLDSLEDPHNVGSLLRSAEGAGVHGVLFPVRRQAPLTPSAIKASAGAVEHLLLCPVDDLASALVDLHGHGVWVAGADGDAALTARQTDLRGPIALVVGSEGQGLGPAVRKRCDLFVRIPLRGAIGSLNAAVAGSVLLFEVAAQRDPDGTAARPVARNVQAVPLVASSPEPEPERDTSDERVTEAAIEPALETPPGSTVAAESEHVAPEAPVKRVTSRKATKASKPKPASAVATEPKPAKAVATEPKPAAAEEARVPATEPSSPPADRKKPTKPTKPTKATKAVKPTKAAKPTRSAKTKAEASAEVVATPGLSAGAKPPARPKPKASAKARANASEQRKAGRSAVPPVEADGGGDDLLP